MKKKLLPLALAAAVASSSGCAYLTDYCSRDKLRESIRKLNPYDFVDTMAVAGCAGLEAFIVEDEKMYEEYPEAVFLADQEHDGIKEGDKGRLLSVDEETEVAEVRIFGKTVEVDATQIAVPTDEVPEDAAVVVQVQTGGDGDGGTVE